ncbi:hypothetical protein D3C85_1222890 [compost metagenome]
MFRPEMAVMAGLVENSWYSQPPARATSSRIRIGLYSSHSPGRVRLGGGGRLKDGSTPQAWASRALPGPGAVA